MSKQRWRLVRWSNSNGYWVVPAKRSREHVVPMNLLSSGPPFPTTNWDRAIFISHHHGRYGRPAKVPVICEYLLCVAVEPEFQRDRLGDYQERFNDLWVPRFGRRAAVAIYVWHVLRQSRLLDWLIRALWWGGPL